MNNWREMPSIWRNTTSTHKYVIGKGHSPNTNPGTIEHISETINYQYERFFNHVLFMVRVKFENFRSDISLWA